MPVQILCSHCVPWEINKTYNLTRAAQTFEYNCRLKQFARSLRNISWPTSLSRTHHISSFYPWPSLAYCLHWLLGWNCFTWHHWMPYCCVMFVLAPGLWVFISLKNLSIVSLDFWQIGKNTASWFQPIYSPLEKYWNIPKLSETLQTLVPHKDLT